MAKTLVQTGQVITQLSILVDLYNYYWASYSLYIIMDESRFVLLKLLVQ